MRRVGHVLSRKTTKRHENCEWLRQPFSKTCTSTLFTEPDNQIINEARPAALANFACRSSRQAVPRVFNGNIAVKDFNPGLSPCFLSHLTALFRPVLTVERPRVLYNLRPRSTSDCTCRRRHIIHQPFGTH